MAIKNEARYQRQIRLKDFGRSGQQKLAKAKVLVIGAGGLGCPALLYLAAAGIGTLGIIDHDIVELSNLHRQTLYTVSDIGRLKADCAAEKLAQLNPDINIIPYPLQLGTQNAALLISKYDLVIDGSDNFPTRYMVNDACVLLNIPLIYGALSENEGQVSVFNVPDEYGTKVNYRDVFPNPPQEGEVLNCAEAGILGFLPGIIGTMQAGEAIKLLSGIGEPLVNKMMIYSGYTNQSYQVKLIPADDADQTSPADLDAFLHMDYKWFCGIKGTTGAVQELDAQEFRKLAKDSAYSVLDVREPGESPEAVGFPFRKVPLSAIRRQIPALDEQKIILFCQSGVRSIIAGEILLDAYPGKEFYSLKGGILRLS